LKRQDSAANTMNCSELPISHPCTRDRRAQLSLCHQNHSQPVLFPPILSARETRSHVNRSFLLTQPFARSNSYFYSSLPDVISLWLWNSLPEFQSSKTLMGADTVDQLDIKPHWLEEVGAFTCRNFSIVALT